MPRPTTSTRAGCSGWIVGQLLEAALGVGGAAGRGELGGQLLALAEPDREQVGVDRGGARFWLTETFIEARVYDLAHGGWSEPPLSSLVWASWP